MFDLEFIYWLLFNHTITCKNICDGLKKPVAPHKTVATSNIDVQHRWNEIEHVFVKMKHKKLLKHYEIPITANSRSWQYIATSIYAKTILDVTFLKKTARNFFIILSLRQVDKISVHMNLVSQFAALVCQPGFHRNKDRIKRPVGQNLGKPYMTWLA